MRDGTKAALFTAAVLIGLPALAWLLKHLEVI